MRLRNELVDLLLVASVLVLPATAFSTQISTSGQGVSYNVKVSQGGVTEENYGFGDSDFQIGGDNYYSGDGAFGLSYDTGYGMPEYAGGGSNWAILGEYYIRFGTFKYPFRAMNHGILCRSQPADYFYAGPDYRVDVIFGVGHQAIKADPEDAVRSRLDSGGEAEIATIDGTEGVIGSDGTTQVAAYRPDEASMVVFSSTDPEKFDDMLNNFHTEYQPPPFPLA